MFPPTSAEAAVMHLEAAGGSYDNDGRIFVAILKKKRRTFGEGRHRKWWGALRRGEDGSGAHSSSRRDPAGQVIPFLTEAGPKGDLGRYVSLKHPARQGRAELSEFSASCPTRFWMQPLHAVRERVLDLVGARPSQRASWISLAPPPEHCKTRLARVPRRERRRRMQACPSSRTWTFFLSWTQRRCLSAKDMRRILTDGLRAEVRPLRAQQNCGLECAHCSGVRSVSC